MVLSDRTPFKMLRAGTLLITPLDKEQVQPAGVDIRLGNTFSIMEDLPTGVVTLKDEVKYETVNTGTYILLPDQFVLVTTMEHASPPDNLIAFVEGRSSLGRLGLFIQNAGQADPGFQGGITLKLFDADRCTIELKAERRVGQLMFTGMDDTALKPYNGEYQGQKGTTGSRVYMD